MSVPDGLLLLLRQGPRHGYQLANEFAEHTANHWKLNTGQVYTTLERLVRDGFVEPDGADPHDERRQRYRLTASGVERADAWPTTTPPTRDALRDELVLRVLLVVSVCPHEAITVIDAQRRLLVERLQAIRRAQRPSEAGLVERLATDATATRVEADLTWLDRCEDRLRAAPELMNPRIEEDPS